MKAHSIWLVMGLILLALSPLQGQEARGTLLGRVTDATGWEWRLHIAISHPRSV